MVHRVQQEEPLSPVAPMALLKSSFILMQTFQDRDQPPFTILLNTAIWLFFLLTTFVSPLTAQHVCLVPDLIWNPSLAEWPRYLGHLVFMQSLGKLLLSTTILFVVGYSLEHRLGTLTYMSMCSIIAVSCAVVLTGLSECLVGLDAVLAAMVIVLHYENPRIHADSMDAGIRVPFAVEPRWHCWLLMIIYLWNVESFLIPMAGAFIGLLWVLRSPNSWEDISRATDKAKIRYGAHVALLYIAVTFFPFSMLEIPPIGNASGVLEVLDVSWWRQNTQYTGPVGVLAYQLEPPVMILLKFILLTAPILLLTPVMHWARAYTFMIAFVLMYGMNSPMFVYPHLGFVLLLYLMMMFWRLSSEDHYKMA